MARILVIDDEHDLQRVLAYNLKSAGHDVDVAEQGREGIELIAKRRPELIILDLMLPDMSGTDVCRALKRNPQTQSIPIVMLTAKGEEVDRIVGFELGAEDYIVKPFSVRELLLRVGAVLRRSSGEPSDRARLVEFGGLRIDRDAHRAWVAGDEVELTALEFKLLLSLCDRGNRVQSRGTLLNDVWGIEADVTTRTVDTHVKRLREKLGTAGEYIETVRGVGYRFAEAPAETASR
ncbi:MAG: response regulator [Polyangiaceae bacterium]|nr:response regulator [Polyangiaceae bacterium]